MKAAIAIPVTLAMVYRAGSHKSLTPGGIVAAVITAAAHALHPWNLPFALLIIFYLIGTRVTKVKHDAKAKLTMQSTGSAGGEGARTHMQVLANSVVASVLTLMHAYQLYKRENEPDSSKVACYTWAGDLLVVGIIANYAAVAADTFSSELGILSSTQPRLITSPSLRKVPPGTNGGVTVWGLVAGLLGSLIIVTVSMALVPFCNPKESADNGWSFLRRQRFTYALTIWGALGSVLDSFLGGWFQMSVVDTRTGRIVEGQGGKRVLIDAGDPTGMHHEKSASSDASKKSLKSSLKHDHPSRIVENGYLNILDNNEVNLLMALTMSLGAMGIASWVWNIPFSSIYTF
ncbi:08e3808e-e3bd-4ddd-890e-e19dbe4581a8 [Sclerotinia trifoliorum]|uniref:08e3808e-e3bd-4ddd-890e-e19dbe4581a8 n=1 Tax=Sclerotinia trifoliorum TaxID=28548 RepID=A0A8H2ZQ40_9HELO|nr:08e3808e-e3bd-4ddd-890e-e19dbe4581a8 [Sclerotinia trifoliorum]